MKTPGLFVVCALLPLAGAFGQALGTIRATTRILPDGSTQTTVTNPDTHTREETIAQTNGKVIRKTLFTLNEQDFATGATHFDSQGKVRYKEVYSFDSTGRISEAKIYSADNQPLGKRAFIYDGKVQNQARIVDYDANGNLIAPGTASTARAGQREVRRAIPVR